MHRNIIRLPKLFISNLIISEILPLDSENYSLSFVAWNFVC